MSYRNSVYDKGGDSFCHFLARKEMDHQPERGLQVRKGMALAAGSECVARRMTQQMQSELRA
jgi:hypothetical protein